MLAREQAEQILRALSVLPSEKVAEVQDFVFYLKQRYAVDESTVWTDEDLRDVSQASLAHADRTL